MFFGGARIEIFGENAASVKNLVYVELDFNLKKNSLKWKLKEMTM